MTLKKVHTIRDREVDENLTRLYANKIEGILKRDGISASAAVIKPFQYIESGDALFSANGSAITTRSFPLQGVQSTIITAIAHARNSSFLASVTDVTQSSITIDCVAWSQTTGRAFSDTTTATVQVYWQVLGSAP